MYLALHAGVINRVKRLLVMQPNEPNGYLKHARCNWITSSAL